MDSSNPARGLQRTDKGIRSTRLAAAGSHSPGRRETPQVALVRRRRCCRGCRSRNCCRNGGVRRIHNPCGDVLDDGGSNYHESIDNDDGQGHNNNNNRAADDDNYDGCSDNNDNTRHSSVGAASNDNDPVRSAAARVHAAGDD